MTYWEDQSAQDSAHGRRIRLGWRAHAGALLLVLTGSSWAALPDFGAPAADEMRAHFIDVGQGASILLEFSCGVALIDTGGEKNASFDSVAALQNYLDRFFARRPERHKTIDLLLLTHAHIDHTRGVPMVLKRYTVRSLVDNGLETGSGGPQQKTAHATAQKSNSGLRWQGISERSVAAREGLTSPVIDPISCTGTDPQISVLWGALDPRDDWKAATLKNGNDSSVVARVQFGKASFLFPGDLEDDVQGSLVSFFTEKCSHDKPLTCPLDVDVYSVGHHGSQNGTTGPLMSALTPRVAIISMGPSDRREQWSAVQYGHPRIDAINKLTDGATGVTDQRAAKVVEVANRAGSKTASDPEFSPVNMTRAVYGTGWDGTVVVTAHSNGQLRVDMERE